MKQVPAGAKFGTLRQQAGVWMLCKFLCADASQQLCDETGGDVQTPPPPLLVAEEILHTTVHNQMHLATVTQYRIVHTITLAVWEPA